jgi:hypothetical protein
MGWRLPQGRRARRAPPPADSTRPVRKDPCASRRSMDPAAASCPTALARRFAVRPRPERGRAARRAAVGPKGRLVRQAAGGRCEDSLKAGDGGCCRRTWPSGCGCYVSLAGNRAHLGSDEPGAVPRSRRLAPDVHLGRRLRADRRARAGAPGGRGGGWVPSDRQRGWRLREPAAHAARRSQSGWGLPAAACYAVTPPRRPRPGPAGNEDSGGWVGCLEDLCISSETPESRGCYRTRFVASGGRKRQSDNHGSACLGEE